MSNIKIALNFAKSLEGVKYKWWTVEDHPHHPELYAEVKSLPTLKTINKTGINCAGLINLMRHKVGLPIPGRIEGMRQVEHPGGTYIWPAYLNKLGRLEPYDVSKRYPPGTLIMRKFKNEMDQGHLAVIYGSRRVPDKFKSVPGLYQKIIHSYPYCAIPIKGTLVEPGVSTKSIVATSYYWKRTGYYTHICLPENWLEQV